MQHVTLPNLHLNIVQQYCSMLAFAAVIQSVLQHFYTSLPIVHEAFSNWLQHRLEGILNVYNSVEAYSRLTVHTGMVISTVQPT